MTTIDWKVILLVFGFLLTIITAVICLIVWYTGRMIRSLKTSLDSQNQRLEEVIQRVQEIRKE
jgi:predicted Holliday junction resolvase-like endonuclease